MEVKIGQRIFIFVFIYLFDYLCIAFKGNEM